MTKKKNLILFYCFIIFGFFLYSFTQIDLSLTFSRISLLRNIVNKFQYIGYFNRPLSLDLYILLLLLLFGFYFYFLKLAAKKQIEKRKIWKLLIIVSVILTFSYNAFSYDLFNYIFDAKIFTHYHLNPYLHKALDFPHDPMLSFMRWTHRTYPYGPFWLILTIPLSFIGFNFFLPTFFLFKLLATFCFLGSLYLITKIFQKITPSKELIGLVFFGLNPLVITESLLSGHLDIVMVFFSLWGTNQLINKKYFSAFLLLLLSIEIKFATILLLPIFILYIIFEKKRKKIDLRLFMQICTILMSISIIFASYYSGNFQPWYLLLPLSFAVFLTDYYIFFPCVIISFFSLLTYAPYLFLGNWNPPVPRMLSILEWGSVVVSLICVIGYFFFKKLNYKQAKKI